MLISVVSTSGSGDDPTAVPRAALSALLLAGVLLAAARSRETRADQNLRPCIDRWNQANMATWGPAPPKVAFRRPVAKERTSIELSTRLKGSHRKWRAGDLAAGGGFGDVRFVRWTIAKRR